MNYVCSPAYSLMLNRSPYGFIKEHKGLRQGHPICPILFVLVIKFITRLMKRSTINSGFKYHPGNKILEVSQSSFADDLLVFCKVEVDSTLCIKSVFDNVSMTPDLAINDQELHVIF